jgi:hypothetical protein
MNAQLVIFAWIHGGDVLVNRFVFKKHKGRKYCTMETALGDDGVDVMRNLSYISGGVIMVMLNYDSGSDCGGWR